MTRKEFLSFTGLAALMLLNIEPLLRLLGKGSHVSTDNGYGSSGYSGFIGKDSPLGAKKTKGFD